MIQEICKDEKFLAQKAEHDRREQAHYRVR